MRYGIISDVHSNLEALQAVLGFLAESRVEGYLSLGDLVGYGPEPDACLRLISALPNLHAVIGNHDLAALGLLDPNWFNPYARAAVLWSRDQISEDMRKFLQNLPPRIETPDFTLVHGTPRRPVEEYLLTVAVFKEVMAQVSVWPLLVGHSHMPLCFRVRHDWAPTPGQSDVEMLFLEDRQAVQVAAQAYGRVPTAFNPGSVGQPRDQDSRTSCALYDTETRTFQLVRLTYDIQAVQNKIRIAGLPEFLALRLAFGQ